jgi:hypothetical protein
MTLQQQHQTYLRSRRDDYVGTAIFALQLAFKATPVNQHEELLNNVYNQIIQRLFGDEIEGLSNSQIAKALGVSHTQVATDLGGKNLPGGGNNLPPKSKSKDNGHTA